MSNNLKDKTSSTDLRLGISNWKSYAQGFKVHIVVTILVGLLKKDTKMKMKKQPRIWLQNMRSVTQKFFHLE